MQERYRWRANLASKSGRYSDRSGYASAFHPYLPIETMSVVLLAGRRALGSGASSRACLLPAPIPYASAQARSRQGLVPGIRSLTELSPDRGLQIDAHVRLYGAYAPACLTRLAAGPGHGEG